MGELLGALKVRRNARFGFGFGALLAVALLVVFVYIPGSQRPPVLYLLLAVVIAFTSGLLVTTILVAVTVWRLAQRID